MAQHLVPNPPITRYINLLADDHILRLDDALIELRKPLPTTAEGWMARDGYARKALILLDQISTYTKAYAGALWGNEKKSVVELI